MCVYSIGLFFTLNPLPPIPLPPVPHSDIPQAAHMANTENPRLSAQSPTCIDSQESTSMSRMRGKRPWDVGKREAILPACIYGATAHSVPGIHWGHNGVGALLPMFVG